MKGRIGFGEATRVTRAALAGQQPQAVAETARRGRAVWVRDEVYAALQERAKAAGVTMSSLLSNLVQPPSYHTPAAREAAAWVKVADRLRSGDLDGARKIVHEVMLALSREHAAEVRDSAKDWDG